MTVINGWKAPERIWLMDLGGGVVTWCEDQNPDGEEVETVEYIRADVSQASPPPQDEVERVKVAFWASLTNANAGMKWLDHDSMDEMIEAAWVGFEQPLRSALTAMKGTGDE